MYDNEEKWSIAEYVCVVAGVLLVGFAIATITMMLVPFLYHCLLGLAFFFVFMWFLIF